MNRPKYNCTAILDDSITQYDYGYRMELEKYCDELEQSNKSLSNAYDDCLVTLHFWEEEYYKYRKALDKFCGLFEDCPFSANGEDCCENCTHEYGKCWKEWALKDEN